MDEKVKEIEELRKQLGQETISVNELSLANQELEEQLSCEQLKNLNHFTLADKQLEEKEKEIEEWHHKYIDAGEKIQSLRMDNFDLKKEIEELEHRIRMKEILEINLKERIKELEMVDTRHGVKLVDRLEEAEKRIKELEDGIKKHKFNKWLLSLDGEGNENYIIGDEDDEELYKLIEK